MNKEVPIRCISSKVRAVSNYICNCSNLYFLASSIEAGSRLGIFKTDLLKQ